MHAGPSQNRVTGRPEPGSPRVRRPGGMRGGATVAPSRLARRVESARGQSQIAESLWREPNGASRPPGPAGQDVRLCVTDCCNVRLRSPQREACAAEAAPRTAAGGVIARRN